MDDSSIAGSYTTNDGMMFTYEASWTHLGSSIAWHAIVRREGQEIARPFGQILFAMDSAAAVAIAVRNSIEKAFRRASSLNLASHQPSGQVHPRVNTLTRKASAYFRACLSGARPSFIAHSGSGGLSSTTS